MFAKGGSPGATEYSMVDVGRIWKATVYRLTADDTIPGAVEALQVCLSLREVQVCHS